MWLVFSQERLAHCRKLKHLLSDLLERSNGYEHVTRTLYVLPPSRSGCIVEALAEWVVPSRPCRANQRFELARPCNSSCTLTSKTRKARESQVQVSASSNVHTKYRSALIRSADHEHHCATSAPRNEISEDHIKESEISKLLNLQWEEYANHPHNA